MHRAIAPLIVASVLAYGGFYLWTNHHQTPHRLIAEQPPSDSAQKPPDPNPDPPEVQQAHHLVTFSGPLADLFTQHKTSDSEASAPSQYTPSSLDHVEDSPMGTSSHILHKTFAVGRAVQVPFEIPPHAATPRFHGTFQSFEQQGASSHDESANVDMLLMNEQQYAEFSRGHDSDVLFVADTSHYQDINFDLPPSLDQPVKYHLVFRNSPGGAAKKVVKADFTVDF